MSILTKKGLADALQTSIDKVTKLYRAGIIKPEFKLGRDPRFDLGEVSKQLAAHQKKQDAKKFKVPTT